MSCALQGYESLWAIFTETALTEGGGRGIEKDGKTVRDKGRKDKGTKWIKGSK
jgi:hypothetical protein